MCAGKLCNDSTPKPFSIHGHFLENDMQTFPQKWLYWNKRCAMFRNVCKNIFFQFWIFINGYAYPPPPILRSGHIGMKDAHSAEPEDNSIF